MYRLTEYCIVPGSSYDITGTCTQNPDPGDAEHLSLITKGENEPTFLISFRNEKDILERLRKRAILHIFGGGLLAVASVVCLLLRFGWL